ncbi:hypothetical protein VCHA53O466_50009 [Vibrio chagasii]|nr:hypothetical protein VCHA53O466_50009 [Vibrio chagasii]
MAILEYNTHIGDVALTAHSKKLMFLHMDFVSSQLNLEHFSAAFVSIGESKYIELFDLNSQFQYVLPIGADIELPDITRFFLSNYGLTPTLKGNFRYNPENNDARKTIDSIEVQILDSVDSLTVAMTLDDRVLIHGDDFRVSMPANNVGVNAEKDMFFDNRLVKLGLTSNKNDSYMSLMINGSYERLRAFFMKHRYPMPEWGNPSK